MGCCGDKPCKPCGKPSKECFVKHLGWSTMSHSAIDSSASVSKRAFLVYRLLVLVFCCFTFVSHYVWFHTSQITSALKYFQYITHWNAMNMLIYFTLGCWYSIGAVKNPAQSSVPLSESKLACFVQFMFELTATSAWFVSLLYWFAVYKGEYEEPYEFFLNTARHGFPAFWMLLEVLLGCGVLVQFHLWMVMLYYVAYVIVNVSLTLGANELIYSVLTYQSSSTAVWLVIAFILVLFVWGLNYLLIRFRSRCCTRRRESVVLFSKDRPAPAAIV